MLAHDVVTPKLAEAEHYMLFLHGILGTRANWRGVARRFVEGRRGWGAILIDLREHGDSLGLPSPHTLSNAASDVAMLEGTLKLPIAGAVGHSFGGKVVLEWLGSRRGRATEAWIIDASPSPTANDRESTATAEVLRVLETLPLEWASKEAFVRAIMDAGQPEGLARWLAMNLRRMEDGRRRFGPDLDAIRDLVDDYARSDLWHAVEAPPDACTVDVVIGGRSHVFSRNDRARIGRIAEREHRVSLHVIESAGHWVHVDSPDRLISLLTSTSSRTP